MSTQQGNRTFEHFLDPEREKKAANRYIVVAIVSVLVAVFGFVVAATGWDPRGYFLGPLAIASALLFSYLAIRNRNLSKLTGDDRLIIALDDEGILGPDLIRAPWPEIEVVQVREFNKGSAVNNPINPSHQVQLMVVVSDHDALAARAQGPQRRYVGKLKDGKAEIPIGLGSITTESYTRALQALEAEAEQRGFAIDHR